jgi:phosphonate transport system substrate-binding protein
MYRLSYYPWLTQNVPAAEIDRQIKIFAGLISEELKKSEDSDPGVQVLPPLDVPQQIDQIEAGEAHIALMNPLGFVFARQRSAEIEAVAVALRIIDGKVGSVYFAQLYTAKKTAIRTLKQVAGRSIGYGVPYSTSNFLIPAAMLREVGVHPLLGVSRMEFLKGHEIVAKAVYEGRVDVGAGHDGVIVDLSNQAGYGDVAEVLIQLMRSPPIPSDPVVVHLSDPAERQRLQQAIIAAGNTTAGKETLKIFWGNAQGLDQTSSDNYSMLRDALQRLHFDESDLLSR